MVKSRPVESSDRSQMFLLDIPNMKKIALFFAGILTAVSLTAAEKWTGTWATAPEYTGENDMPKTMTLTDNALRQVIHVSLGGDELRMKLSNEFSDEPVEIKSVLRK